MKALRRAELSGAWYPDDKKDVTKLIDFWKPYFEKVGAVLPKDPQGTKLVMGVVPHAGWVYSGKLAASVFKCAKDLFSGGAPDQIVILGGHLPAGTPLVSYTEDLWETPLEPVSLTPELNEKVHKSGPGLSMSPWKGRTGDNTIEVELPLLKHFFPDSPTLALRVSPDEQAASLGKALGSILKDKSALIIASTDLTHYGLAYGFAPAGKGESGLKFREQNDKTFIDAALSLDSDSLLEHARRQHSACSAGAVAAVTSLAQEIGASSHLLDYYASSDISADDSISVGYAGMLFY